VPDPIPELFASDRGRAAVAQVGGHCWRDAGGLRRIAAWPGVHVRERVVPARDRRQELPRGPTAETREIAGDETTTEPLPGRAAKARSSGGWFRFLSFEKKASGMKSWGNREKRPTLPKDRVGLIRRSRMRRHRDDYRSSGISNGPESVIETNLSVVSGLA